MKQGPLSMCLAGLLYLSPPPSLAAHFHQPPAALLSWMPSLPAFHPPSVTLEHCPFTPTVVAKLAMGTVSRRRLVCA